MKTLKELDVIPGDVVRPVHEGPDEIIGDPTGTGMSFVNIDGKSLGTDTLWQIVNRAPRAVPCTQVNDVVPGYEELAEELQRALDQSQRGKGVERHANSKPFTQQPLMEISRMTGPGGAAYQAMKKTQEALGMYTRDEHDRAIAELHGAIIYAAACAMLIREKK